MRRFTFHLIICLSIISSGLFSQSLVIENGATVTVDGDGNTGTRLNVDGTLDIKGEMDLLSDAQLFIAGDFLASSASRFDPGQSTVHFDGSGATPQQIASSGSGFIERFFNVVINSSANVEIDDASGIDVYINNILTPQAGTFTTNGALLMRNTSTIKSRVAFGTGTVSGIVRVEKRLNSDKAGWRQMGMPVELPNNVGEVNWDKFTNRLGILLAGYTPADRINTFIWDATDADGAGGNDFANGWQPATDAATSSTAFNIYLSNNPDNLPFHYFGAPSAANQFEIDGELNQGDFLYNLEYTRDPADAGASNNDAVGWNFIPNPWVAYLDIETLLATGNSNFTPTYKAVHVLDATNLADDAGQYRAILASGVTKINYNTPGGDLTASSQNFDTFQGFWVKADAPGQICNLEAATLQVTNFKGQRFLKKEFETIRLNVFDQDSLWDQLVIYFNPTSTRNFDLDGDAYYLASMNEDAPRFYANEGTSKASIVSRTANVSDSVEVAFGTTKSQSKFYLNADLDELPENWFVYLRDKRTNKTYKLNNNTNLEFSHADGLNSNRFVVYYSKNENAFNHLVTGQQQEVIAFVRNGKINLQSRGISSNAQISLYDATGRLLYRDNKALSLDEEIEISINPLNQFIVIETVVDGDVFVEKLYF